MSLPLSHSSLLRNVEHSRSRTEKMNKVVQEQLTKRLGGFYGQSDGATLIDQEAAPRENYYHRWCSYVVPQLTNGTPRVDVETTRAEEQGEDALYLDMVGNRWIEDVKLNDFMANGPVIDMQHAYGAMYIAPEEMVGEEPIVGVGSDFTPDDPEFANEPARVPWQPKAVRLPQGRYFCDMVAMTADEVRFEGHTFSVDRNELTAEDGWDLEVTNALNADDASELEMLGRVEVLDDGPKRHELVFHEVWVKGANPGPEQLKSWGVEPSPGAEEGFNGWVFTLAAKDEKALEDYKTQYAGVEDSEEEKLLEAGKWPRRPRPFYGPEWGPYQLYYAHTATNSPIGIGPLLACESEIRAANTDSQIVAQMIRKYKRLVLLNGRTDKDDVSVIKDGEHDNIYRVKGLDRDGIFSAEIGGVTDQVAAHLQTSKELVEETLGLDQMHSGSSASSANTATRDAIADSAASVRFSGIEQGYLRGLAKTMRTVLWYFHEDNRMVRDLGPGAAKSLGMAPMGYVDEMGEEQEIKPQPRYFGGRRGARSSFRSLHVAIQPHSIRRVSEGLKQHRALQAMNIVLQVVPLSTQFPSFPWGEFMEFMGDNLNIPSLGKLFREETVGRMAQEAMDMGIQGGGGPVPLIGPAPGGTGLPGNQTGAVAGMGVAS